MTELEVPLTYANRTGRGPGRVVRTLGLVMRGIARVRAQADPYADAWHAHNLAVLADAGSTRRRWVVLGDSMSQSVGAPGPRRGWVDQLRERLVADGVDLDVINLSATGARTADVLAQQLPALATINELVPSRSSQADLVTVMVGSNDLFAGRAVRAALPDAFARLAAAVPAGAIVTTLPQPSGAAEQANRHVEQAARAGRLRLLDLRTTGPTSWRGLLAEDRFHPNEAGYAAIADAFEPTVRAALAAQSSDR